MHKILRKCSNTHLINYMLKLKVFSNGIFKFPEGKSSRLIDCNIYRIICTDSKLQAQNQCQLRHEITNEQEIVYYHSPFLRENFNIIDNRYFKLISISNDSQFEELLKKEELKEILTRSSFTFDVSLSQISACNIFPISDVSFNSLEDISKNTAICSLKKESPDVFVEHVWFSKSDANASDTGKPSEQQLLYVIDRLTYSLLNFFEKPHDFSIYHKNIVFQNHIRGVTTKGLTAYIQAMYILKLYGLFQYARVKVEILKITHHTEDGTVRVRWRVNGISRHQLLVSLWKHKKLVPPENETEWLDGFSVFSVGPDGLIYKHICDKLTPDHEVAKPKKSLKSRLLGLMELSQRSPAGSLHALMSCYRNQIVTNCKRIT